MPTIRGFPERPSEYQFIHPVGAILVGYGGSKFGDIEQLGRIAQQRDLRLMLTVFGSSLNADDGTLAILDETRLAMVGFAPPSCQPCHLMRGVFSRGCGRMAVSADLADRNPAGRSLP